MKDLYKLIILCAVLFMLSSLAMALLNLHSWSKFAADVIVTAILMGICYRINTRR